MRSGIMEMEKENIIMKKDIASLRSLYHDAMTKVRNLESLLLNAESVNESLQRKFNDYNNLVDECNAVVSEHNIVLRNFICYHGFADYVIISEAGLSL